MAESLQVFDKLFVSADDATYAALEFLQGSTIGLNEEFFNPEGIRGTRQESAERTRRVKQQVQGNLRFCPAASELDLLIPMILGTAKTNDTTAIVPAETIPARYFTTYRDGTLHKYAGCKVASAVFSASENGPLTVEAAIQGVSEAAGSTRNETISDDAGPYVLSDCALTVGGSSYNFRQLSIQVDNQLETKWNNSVTPSAIHSTGMKVQVSLALPYGDASALYGSSIAGVAVVATFTNGNRSIILTASGVQAPKQPLPFGGRGARDLPWVGMARKTGSTNCLTITNDSSG